MNSKGFGDILGAIAGVVMTALGVALSSALDLLAWVCSPGVLTALALMAVAIGGVAMLSKLIHAVILGVFS